MAWYTLQTNPNYEAKVIQGIETRKAEKGLHQIREIFAPVENIVEYKDGKKKERKKRLYTNYIFLEMDYSEDVWHALKGIRGVVGFVGNKTNPDKLTDKEVERMKIQVSDEAPKHKVSFAENDTVRILSGPFADFLGLVKAVPQYEKNKITVKTTVFNREMDVELSLDDVELVKE